MRKIIVTLFLLILTRGPVFAEPPQCDESKYRPWVPPPVELTTRREIRGQSIGPVKEFVVYLDKGNRQNHFVSSGWIGDFGDIKMDDGAIVNPYSGATSIQFTYSAKKSQDQDWAGVYWQNPANNWGSKVGGFDLTGIAKLTFWARGAKGGEVIQKFVVGGIKGVYPDSTQVEFGPVELTDTWKQYVINLVGKNLSYLNGAFSWVATAEQNPDGIIFYLDDIKFEVDPDLKLQTRSAENMPFYVYLDKGSAKNHFVPSGWMGDYGDLTYSAFYKENPYSGDTCIKISYCVCAYQGARWAGIYWQNPANNWGNIDAGYNLSNATKLTFWARGSKSGERIEEFKVGGISGEYADSDTASIGPMVLNKEWTQYTIDLKGKDMSYIIGGFCWVANVDGNPEGSDFYLDEIKFE